MEKTTKIILIIVSIIVLMGVGIKACTNKMGDIVNSVLSSGMNYEHSECYTAASTGAIAPMAREIQIAWINGSVRVEYADTDSIRWTETYVKGEAVPQNQLHYWLDGHTLYINYFAANNDYAAEEGLNVRLHKSSDKKKTSIRNISKDLVLVIPQNWMLDELEVHAVNGDIATSVDAREIDVESVNGSKTVRVREAHEIKLSGVNGSGYVYLPENVSFEAEIDKVNGSFQSAFPTRKEGDKYYYGNSPYVEIELEAINGDLRIEQL